MYLDVLLKIIVIVGTMLAYPLRSFASNEQIYSSPKVTGSVAISLSRGQINGQVCLSEFNGPAGLEFLLNKGLNIKKVSTLEGKNLWFMGWHSLAQGELVGEGIKYTIQLPQDSTIIEGFCVEYVGAFPVFAKGERFVSDNNGLNVFQPTLFRGTEQSKWLPNTYSSDSKIEGYTYRYDITIICKDCLQIYLNGSEVQPGPVAKFSSGVAREMVILAGNLNQQEFESFALINLETTTETVDTFNVILNKISTLHQNYTGIKMREAPVFFGMNLIAPWSEFSFASWPTIGLGDVKDLSKLLEKDRLSPWLGKLLAHEMGHYYFGTVFKNPGPLTGIYGESFTEFFSLKFLLQEYGQEAYENEILKKLNMLENWDKWLPINEVKGFSDTRYVYRYVYIPLLYIHLENKFGTPWFQNYVQTTISKAGNEPVTFEFFKNTFFESGRTKADWQEFLENCLTPKPMDGCLANFKS